jgi:hypothetical protein
MLALEIGERTIPSFPVHMGFGPTYGTLCGRKILCRHRHVIGTATCLCRKICGAKGGELACYKCFRGCAFRFRRIAGCKMRSDSDPRIKPRANVHEL